MRVSLSREEEKYLEIKAQRGSQEERQRQQVVLGALLHRGEGG